MNKTLVIVHCVLAALIAGCATPHADRTAAQLGAAEPATPATRAEAAPRLSDDLRPTAVALHLDIDPQREDFSGEVRIDLTLAHATETLRINATDLGIDTVKIGSDAERQTGSSAQIDADVVELRFARAIPAGKTHLRVAFHGRMDSTRSRGLYRVQEPDGRWYAYTFFEPIDARRAFPGFDQPDAKIPWTLNIRTHGQDIAAANTASASVTPSGDGQLYRFESTRPLPSYLVAFMVGPFDVVDGGRAGRQGTPIRFVLPQGHRAELRYALAATPRAVESLETFFGTAFPYPKLDVAVVPRYWGTMEHPGLVAMGQPLTLIEPHEETPDRHQAYANILIHELAHYWFGDWVTMKWWDDVWLNEALATWADTHVSAAFEPAWRWDLHWNGHAAGAMSADVQRDISPLRRRIVTRSDIGAAFENAITYSKGASVLRMFEQSVGAENFRRGLRGYFARHADGNADADDFIAAMADVAAPAQIEGLRSFLDQGGVPLLHTRLDCGAGGARLRLRQERFMADGPGEVGDRLWKFPVCAKYGRGAAVEQSCTLLSAAEGVLPLAPDLGCPEWLIANADAAGYYRVDYADGVAPTWFAHPAINALERRALASDVGALAAAGYTEVGSALALIPVLASHPDPAVPRTATRLLQALVRGELLGAERLESLRAYVREMFAARALAMGWVPAASESSDERTLRHTLLTVAGIHGRDSEILRQASALTRDWLAEHSRVDADVAMTALGIAAVAGEEATVDAMFAAAMASSDRDDRASLFGALGMVIDPARRQRAFEITLDPAIDMRESSTILYAALYSPENAGPALQFLIDNFDRLMPRMRDDEKSWLIASIGGICDAAQGLAAEQFLKPRVAAIDGGELALRKALYKIDTCVAQWQRNRAGVEAFLDGTRARP